VMKKTKVKLVIQTLGASVADGLLFCKNTLHLPLFEDCDATVESVS